MKIQVQAAVAALLAGAGLASAQGPVGPGGGAPEAGAVRSAAPAAAAANGVPAVGNGTYHAPEVLGDCGAKGIFAGCTNGGRGTRFYASGEYILWNMSDGTIPAINSFVPVGVLVVDSVDTFVDVNTGGVAQPPVFVQNFAGVAITSQAVPAGGLNANVGAHNGFRATIGAWLVEDERIGVEGSFYSVEPRSQSFSATTGNQINQFLITTPFFDRVFTVTPGSVVATNGTTTTNPASISLRDQFPIFFLRQTQATTWAR
jgi:hypothetical protein